MSGSTIIGAVEIGTSKVIVLVGELYNGRELQIIGLGQSTASGVRKGEIVDLRAASDCTHAALLAAEKCAGTEIDLVYLAITGGHLDGFSNSGVVTVEDADNWVRASDIQRASDNARSKALPPGRLYVHHVRSGYVLDGRPCREPLDRQGASLESHYWHVHGDERKLADPVHVINGFSLRVEDMVVSSIASGSMVTLDEEKEAGVLVVDIGCGTTDYVLYRHGRIVRSGVIAVGGDHFTNDLSLGLRVSYKHAESLKLRYGKAVVDRADKSESVMLVGDLMIGDRPIPRQAINKILHARADELFMILQNKLGSLLSPQNLPIGVILTGGGSRLPELPALGESILGVPVRAGQNPGWTGHQELREPEFSTALGVMHYGLSARRTDTRAAAKQPPRKWVSKVKEMFK
ncbi:MAG: cell division protein FtsA [Opitutales bacterium]